MGDCVNAAISLFLLAEDKNIRLKSISIGITIFFSTNEK